LDESPQKKACIAASQAEIVVSQPSSSIHINECSRDSLIMGKLDVSVLIIYFVAELNVCGVSLCLG
jgi:hypothetical protein